MNSSNDARGTGRRNSGVQNTGPGTINMSGNAVGKNATVWNLPARERDARPASRPRAGQWDIGVITVISAETRAMTTVLAAGDYRKRTSPSGLRFHEAHIDTAGSQLAIVATQSLDRGQRSAALAFEQLRQHYDPAIFVLVGIAGGISLAVSLGDVVVVQEVIYYDLRKETPGGVFRRGQSRPVPAATRRAINDFFSDHGEPYRATIQDQAGTTRTCKVLPGPIGSGEAVIADQDSAIRQYVTAFNDKTLAAETEAGGIAEAFYEMADASPPGGGWLAIRGISDRANADKDDFYHDIASWHAATIFREMLPYLRPAGVED